MAQGSTATIVRPSPRGDRAASRAQYSGSRVAWYAVTCRLWSHAHRAAARRVPPDVAVSAVAEVPPPPAPAAELADVAAVYTSRADFGAKLPTAVLLYGATDVRAAGLSLNALCQHYPDESMRRLIEDGASVRCLFLDPQGDAIRVREREERHSPGALSALTELNIGTLVDRVRPRLSPAARDRLEIRVYDETVRNVLLIDGRIGVVQPYLPESRGTDSPTLVLDPTRDAAGLYSVFEQVFESLWERGKPR